jgi:hypothetical protein
MRAARRQAMASRAPAGATHRAAAERAAGVI